MLEIVNIRVKSFELDYLDLFWELEPTSEDVNDYSFVVEKSYSEFGPFSDLTKPFKNRFHLRDNTVRGQHSFYNKSFYRIRLVHDTSKNSTTFPKSGAGVKLAALPDLAALEMARMERLKLKEFKGRKLWVFPRKTFGQRCKCYDAVTSRKLRSSCPSCFDTGWAGGYDRPLEVFGQIIEPAEFTAKSPLGEIEQQNSVGYFPNYPEVHEGWVIVEAENIRWRVGPQIVKVRKARALVRQEVQLHRIPAGDVEYSLPVNVGDLGSLVATPTRNLVNPQTLDASKVIDKALGL